MSPLLLLAVLAAGPAGETLDDAKTAIEDLLDFERGAKLLHELLEREDLPVDDRRRAYRMLAPCEVARDRNTAAVDTYYELLIVEPNFEPEAWRSPKVRAAFREAKARFEDRRPRLRIDPPALVDNRLVVTGTLVDPNSLTKTVVLLHRADGDTKFEEAPARAAADFEMTIPAASRLSYFVEARGTYDQRLANVGDADQPLLHSVTATPPPVAVAATNQWYEQWWVWTLVGVAVAGGVTAAVVATSSGGRDDLFEIRLPP